MGFLRQMLAHTGTPDRSPLSDYWFGPVGRSVLSGVDVDENTAFNYSAVWAASRLISDTISTLPRFLFRTSANGKERAIGHPTYKTFSVQPNPESGSVNYFAQQTNFVVNWGNCFAEIKRDTLGRTIEMWPIHPSRIPDQNIKRNRVDQNVDVPGGDTGEIVYFVRNNNMSTTPILKRDMFHLPGVLSENGITGKGVIRQAAESIGMGIATERYGSSLFGSGAAPSIIMKHPGVLSEKALENLKRSWKSQFDGPGKTNGLLITEEGIEIERLTIPPDEAQFLSTRQFNITEIARWYNLPVHMLREMSKSSFNNIESENLQFLITSIMPWLVRWEDELRRQLLLDGDQNVYFFKFMLQGLLRGDMKSRSEFYSKMWFMGVFSINDILEFEDRNTIGPKGDVRFRQSSMVPIDAPGKQQEQKRIPPDVEGLISLLMQSIESREVIAVDMANETREQMFSRFDDMAATVSGHMVPRDYFDKHFSGLQSSVDGLRSEVIRVSERLDITNDRFKSLSESTIDAMDRRNDESKRDMAEANREAKEFNREMKEAMGSLSITVKDGVDECATQARLAKEYQLEADKTLLSATQLLFRGEFSKIVRKEVKGARWAAKKPREFQSRLDTWFEKHKTTYRSSELTAVFNAMQLRGVSCDLQEFMDEQTESSYTELIEASGGAKVETLATVIDETVAVWENEKVERVAEFVFTGVVDGK